MNIIGMFGSPYSIQQYEIIEIYLVRCDGLQMTMEECYKDSENRILGYTNNLEKFYQHIYIDGFYNMWDERIVYYAKRQAGVEEAYDRFVLLCIYGENDIFCIQQDSCLCTSVLHAHLEPICICDFPSASNRILRVNQDSNRS